MNYDPNLNPNTNRRGRLTQVTQFPNPSPSQHNLFCQISTVSMVPGWSHKIPGDFYRLAVARVCLHVDDDNFVCEDSRATGLRY